MLIINFSGHTKLCLCRGEKKEVEESAAAENVSENAAVEKGVARKVGGVDS